MTGFILVVWLLINNNILDTSMFGPFYSKADCEAAFTTNAPNISTLQSTTTTASIAHMCMKTSVVR